MSRSGIALAAAGAIAFSGKAIIVKLAYRHGVDAVTLIMYRMLFALPLFVLLSWWAGRGKPALTLRDWQGVVALGLCGYYIASALDFAGLQYITASLERLILYLSPTIVLGLGRVVLKKKISPVQWQALGLTYCGVLVVFGHELDYLGNSVAWGSLLVFGSTVSYAVYLFYCGQEVKRLGAMRLSGLATSVACVMCLLQFIWLKPWSAMQVAPQVIYLSVGNAILCTFCPVVMVMLAIERIGSGLTAQIGMIGPVSTILMGIFILDEPFTVWTVVGTLGVFGGVWWLARSSFSSST
jgi:drug/metabolite transporter (DMT)-like permease